MLGRKPSWYKKNLISFARLIVSIMVFMISYDWDDEMINLEGTSLELIFPSTNFYIVLSIDFV